MPANAFLIDLINGHALADCADGLEVAIAAAYERNVVNGVAVQIELNQTSANALRLTHKMLHGDIYLL